MKVSLPKCDLNVVIHHNRPDLENNIKLASSKEQFRRNNRPSTECYITFPNGTVVSSVATCASTDQFRRRKGATIALKHALEKTSLSKEERTLVYKRMFNVS